MTSNILRAKPYKLAVVIGRFQLKHVGHELLFNKAASVADYVLVLIGSSYKPRTIKDPFTYIERSRMIVSHFHDIKHVKAAFTDYLVDNLYSDTAWVKQVQAKIANSSKKIGVEKDSEICIVGFKKDETSYYLDLFPQYKYETIDEFKMQLDATSIRNILYTEPEKLELLGNIVPAKVRAFLGTFIQTESYKRLVREFKYYQDYKPKYGEGPFVTVDGLIVKSGHICLIKRGDDPGMDLWALPGGFLERDEFIIDGCLREMNEETNIDVPPGLFKGSLVKEKVFDHPGRSLRGRVITHAYLFNLDGKDKKPGLPSIRAESDAKEAKWFPIDTVLSMGEMMFEDHLDMIKYMLGLE